MERLCEWIIEHEAHKTEDEKNQFCSFQQLLGTLWPLQWTLSQLVWTLQAVMKSLAASISVEQSGQSVCSNIKRTCVASTSVKYMHRHVRVQCKKMDGEEKAQRTFLKYGRKAVLESLNKLFTVFKSRIWSASRIDISSTVIMVSRWRSTLASNAASAWTSGSSRRDGD